ncbi:MULTISPECIES: hypothetical protein [unclassified Burkholderia]|uniref:hypothetical protein n=1 Tax=unclassified Burkholderia TaxID=2613784 RepID=UPI001E5CC7DB|nr:MULTISPECIES: hypothetical protein [unclassified Burkholderia]UEP31712.1 hypothetical protein LMA01_21140 [Burkholderia sp. B21-007]UEP43044.1 hypothetical protein LMA02_23490 [Burkholderia sp. B21-005]
MIKAIFYYHGPVVFEHALRCVEIRLEESIFIDNPVENLISPSALGMSVVFHDDEKNDGGKRIATLRDEFHIQKPGRFCINRAYLGCLRFSASCPQAVTMVRRISQSAHHRNMGQVTS